MHPFMSAAVSISRIDLDSKAARDKRGGNCARVLVTNGGLNYLQWQNIATDSYHA